VLARIERKLAEVQRWVDSVHGIADVPAAIALAKYRTRPSSRPHTIWVRPRRLAGLAIQLHTDSSSDFVIYEEVFVDGIYDLSKVAFTPDAVIDCGAYHGYFSLLAAASYPGVPIIAFEPNAANLVTLEQHVRRNAVAVDVRPSAVSSRDGSAMFAGGGCGGHLSADESGAVTVPLTNLCRVISEIRSDALLLKLDIEGEEQHLLPALIDVLPGRCAIFFEWHQGDEAYRSIVTWLATHGFTTATTRENRVDADTVYIDAFAQRR